MIHPIPQIVAYPQLSSLEQNNQWNSPPADALVSTSNTTYSNLSGLRLTDSPRPSSSTTSGCSLQSQGQHNPPFRLKPDASKSDIDEYCTKLKRGGYRNIPCPFCGGEQDRVSGLKRHLYFRFRVDEYTCQKGCGQRFPSKDNGRRHSKKCEGSPKDRGSRPELTWVPHCQPSTRARLRRDRSSATGKPYNY